MFFSITRGMNFSITRGENFILAHPLGEELYSCNVLLIDHITVRYSKELKKFSNKLRMKALVGWNTLFQVLELINLLVFFTRIKNEIHKEDKIVFKV